MARSFVVNGACAVQTGTGSVNALEDLGISTDGISVTLHPHQGEIPIDSWGSMVPGDLQAMLASATISMTLVYFDQTVLDKSWNRSLGLAGGGTVGTVPACGTLIGAGSFFVRLLLLSPIGGVPYNFLSTYLTGAGPAFNMGTRYKAINLEWKALPYSATPTASSGTVLWNTVTS